MRLLLSLNLVIGASSFAFIPPPAFTSPTSTTTLFDAASSTSIYTNIEAADSYPSLETVLKESCKDQDTVELVNECMATFGSIADALRTALVTLEGSANTFGDSLLTVDVIADEILWKMCADSKVISTGASEEDPDVRMFHEKNKFALCWDPLDGSSIVDSNFAVGTIIGVWDQQKTGFLGATGRDQVTSLCCMYGPRTTALIGLDDGVYEFTRGATAEGARNPDGSLPEWVCSRSKITIGADTKIFSPANLRATQEIPGYMKYFQGHLEKKTTLRYTGGMVPDIYQQFTKQQGIFTNPTCDKAPAKLRLAFEAAPLGLLVEQAGGKTSDGVTGGSVLDVKINTVDQRTALAIGSSNEVERFNKDVLGK